MPEPGISVGHLQFTQPLEGTADIYFKLSYAPETAFVMTA